MNKVTNDRAQFATKFGAIAATVGSAVGLGNIWRFPYEAGVHGGGAFLVCYIAFLFIICVPVLCAEFALGRNARSNVFGSYQAVSPRKGMRLPGYLSIAASLLIMGFYSVVAGWTMEYCLTSATGNLESITTAAGHGEFVEMTTGWRPVLWTMLFLACNTFILMGGVTKGIERASNIMMPILFVLLLAFCVNSLLLPNSMAGVSFLFKPDFSQITPSVLLGALGQAFFSLSLGMGTMITYASYFNSKTKLVRTAMTTALLDTMVAIIAGLIIFPAVFSFGMSPSEGPKLVFEVLPTIFAQLPGGAIWSTLFFLLLFIASLTSTVSVSETTVSFFCEEKKMSRKSATWVATGIAVAGGLLCSLSFGALSDVTIFGKTFFDLFDYVSSNICLPLGGMICSLTVGWLMKKRYLEEQLTDYHTHRFRFIQVFVFILRWVCPAAILLVFLNSIGIM